MFCPNCGKENSLEQSFCRACGINLEDTARSLVAQQPSGLDSTPSQSERNLEIFGAVVFGGLGLVILTAVVAFIYLIITKMILSGTQPALGIMLILFSVFGLLTLVYVYKNESLKEKSKKRSPQPIIDTPESVTTGKLLEEKPFEPIPSVTEPTTDLLFVEQKTKKFE